MTTPPSDLRADIDTFVAELLTGYSPRLPPDDKVVHDPIWGTHRFRRHEVALIDSPVLQRLRRIYQTGFSFYAYPSTTQTREAVDCFLPTGEPNTPPRAGGDEIQHRKDGLGDAVFVPDSPSTAPAIRGTSEKG